MPTPRCAAWSETPGTVPAGGRAGRGGGTTRSATGLVGLHDVARGVAREALQAGSDLDRIAHANITPAQGGHRRVEVAHEDRVVLAEARRHVADDEVHLLATDVEPGTCDRELRAVGA